MPERTVAATLPAAIGLPSNRRRPPLGACAPTMHLSSVVLPAPLWPKMPTRAAGASLSVTSLSAVSGPYRADRLSMASMWCRPSVPKIELGEVGIGDQLGDAAARQNAALEHEHRLITEVADKGDVVFHDTDRDARLRDFANNLLHRLIGLAFDTGHRLVEQETAGVIHEGAGDADELLLSIGQIADRFVGAIRQTDAGENVERLGAGGLGRGADFVRPKHEGDQRLGRIVARTDDQVVEHRQRGEETNVLPGARQAASGSLVQGEPVKRLTVERDVAPIGRIEARYQIE